MRQCLKYSWHEQQYPPVFPLGGNRSKATDIGNRTVKIIEIRDRPAIHFHDDIAWVRTGSSGSATRVDLVDHHSCLQRNFIVRLDVA